MNKIIDKQCPGNDPTLRTAPEIFICPECRADVEIWTDEKKGKCTSCSSVVRKDLAENKG